MEGFLQLLVMGVLVEAVWENSKIVWQDGKFSIDMLGALLLGIIIAIATGTDILLIAGLHSTIPILGMVLSGILASRGANVVHDIIEKIRDIRG